MLKTRFCQINVFAQDGLHKRLSLRALMMCGNCGTRTSPSSIMLCVITLTAFMSLWISNGPSHHIHDDAHSRGIKV